MDGTVIDRLEAAYAVEAETYMALMNLSAEQGRLLAARQIGEAEVLFDRKGALLCSLARIEVEIEPLKRAWQTGTFSHADRDRLNARLDGILVTIERLVELEQANEAILLGVASA